MGDLRMPAPKKDTITIVVNGTAVEVKANDNAPLHTIVNKALADTQNSGQPATNWDLKTASGQILDQSKKIGEFNFPENVVLYLSLKAGAGGEIGSVG